MASTADAPTATKPSRHSRADRRQRPVARRDRRREPRSASATSAPWPPSGTQGAELIERETFDIVITDLKMTDVDGLEILARAKKMLPDAEVILVTGHGTIPSAVAAMQQGAFNYLQKPLDLGHLRVDRREGRRPAVRLRRTNVELNRRLDEKFGFEGVIGTSPQMNEVIDRLKRIAPTDASVLIQGETGTGKELVAQAIHQNSPRKNKPFVALELRRAEREHSGKRAVRPRPRGVHRRLDRSGRQVRIRPRRHAVSRRSRRHAAGHADQAAARAGKRRDHARRLERADHASTCASSRPPIATWRTRSRPARFAAISITGSRS